MAAKNYITNRTYATLTYEQVLSWLGDKESRKLAHNTTVTRFTDMLVVHYHGHPIVTLLPEKTIINVCGWYTATTKHRMNWFHGVSVYQKNYQWYINGDEYLGGEIVAWEKHHDTD